jgi:hypothetical protein
MPLAERNKLNKLRGSINSLLIEPLFSFTIINKRISVEGGLYGQAGQVI